MAGPPRVKLPPAVPPTRIENNPHDIPSRLRGKTDPNVPPDHPLPLLGTSLHVFPQADGRFEAGLSAVIRDAELESIGVLTSQTTAGNPAVGLLVRLPDGRQVLVETTLKLLLTAAGMMVAVHGDPRR